MQSYELVYSFLFPGKVLVAGQQTALGRSIMAIVNMAPMSPKTSWISLTTPRRRLSDKRFLTVYQNPLLTLHISALQPLAAAPAPQVAHTNKMRLCRLVGKGDNQVCLALRN